MDARRFDRGRHWRKDTQAAAYRNLLREYTKTELRNPLGGPLIVEPEA